MTTAVDTSMVQAALVAHLASKNLIQWNPSLGYSENPNRPAGRFGILTDSPATQVSINVYDHSTARDDHNPDIFVQLRFRAAGRDPRVVDRLADAVFAELHWSDSHPAENWPGGVHVLQCRRVVRGPSAPDSSDRYERPDSYRITFNPGD